MIDLADNPVSDPSISLRPSPASMIRIEHGLLGMLTVHVPPKSCYAIQLGFLGGNATAKQRHLSTKKSGSSVETSLEGKEVISDEHVNAGVKETHSLLRSIHLAIFDELVNLIPCTSYSVPLPLFLFHLQLIMYQLPPVTRCLNQLVVRHYIKSLVFT